MASIRKSASKGSRSLAPNSDLDSFTPRHLMLNDSRLTMNREDIERLMDDAKESALATGQVGVNEWHLGGSILQLIWVVRRHIASHPGAKLSTEQILKYVEDALKDLIFIPRLEQNPLTSLIDLRPFQYDDDPPHYIKGRALQRALDEAISAIEGSASQTTNDSEVLRAERYLSLRYRERMKHYQIAQKTGWSDRNLERLRRELLERVASFLFTRR